MVEVVAALVEVVVMVVQIAIVVMAVLVMVDVAISGGSSSGGTRGLYVDGGGGSVLVVMSIQGLKAIDEVWYCKVTKFMAKFTGISMNYFPKFVITSKTLLMTFRVKKKT